jgi:hypothetical protein
MSFEPLGLVLYIATIVMLWRVVESRGGEYGGGRPGLGGCRPRLGTPPPAPQAAAGRARVLG